MVKVTNQDTLLTNVYVRLKVKKAHSDEREGIYYYDDYFLLHSKVSPSNFPDV